MRYKPVSASIAGLFGFLILLLWTSQICIAQIVPAGPVPARVPAPVSSASSASSPRIVKIAPDYSKEAYVVDKYDISSDFHADGTWEETATVVVQVKSQAGILQFGNLSIPYESRNQKADFIYIRIRKPDGTIVETPSAYTQDMPAGVTLQAPMYSDLHIKQVPVTNLNPGDTLEYQFKIVQFQAEVPNEFWLAENFFKSGIALEEDFQVRVPTSKHVQVESADLQPTVHKEGKTTVYEWKTAHLHQEPTDRKSLALKADEKPSIQLTTFKNWQQVGEWYRKLESTQAVVTPAIQQNEQELTKGLTTDDAKQRAIYDYVATQFRYIGLSFGIGRYQPHAAAEVLQNKFGDCKDKHTLFAALMKAAGYDVWPALIGSSGKLDETIPYPGQFDHVISVLHKKNDTVWLDTTEEVAPYGMLMLRLRDKTALVIPTDGAPKLEKTPIDPPFAEADDFTMKAVLSSDDVLTGHADLTARGDLELGLRVGFHLTPEANWTKLGQDVSYLLGFSGDVTNAQAGNPDDTSKPFQMSYDYTKKDYGGSDGKQFVAPLPAIRFSQGENDPQPKDPIVLGAPGIQDFHSTVQLPKGDVLTLPADADIQTAFAEYKESASVKDGVLYAERRLQIKEPNVPASQWQDYLKFEKAVQNRENLMITVTTGNAAAPASAAIDVPAAKDLINQAYAALRLRNVSEAQTELSQAQKLNPSQWGLWATYSLLYMEQNKTDQAIEAYHKEIANHPDNEWAYQYMANVFTSLHRPGDAEQVWRSLLKYDPSKASGNLALGALLMREKKYSEAIPLLKKAASGKDANAGAQEELATAELEGGDKEAGIADLEKIMRTSQDPNRINDAAYVLADHDDDVAEAATFAAKALQTLEASTGAIDLATLSSQDLRRISLLGAIWDTVGWIDFKQAKYADARRYAQAAWQLEQSPDVADHLAQIYQKEGKLADARHMRELASASRPLPPPPLVKPGMATAATSYSENPEREKYVRELQDLRTFELSGLPRKMAAAQFWIVFTPQGVGEIKMIVGDSSLSSAANLLKKHVYKQTFPDPGPEKIVRRGVLSCSQFDRTCQFVLLQPQWTQL